MSVWLLMHGGYDFEPTTLAVCSSQKKAKAMLKEHYAIPENKDFPWNGCYIVKAEIDGWVPYPKDGEVRSIGATLEEKQNDLPATGSLTGLAKAAGLIK